MEEALWLLAGKHEMTMRVFGVTGWKNSGKTTLVEALVRELTGRGWKVATVKHAHHYFDIDKEGTDSFRHRKAGAKEVAIVSGRRWAVMHELGDEEEPTLDDMLSRLSPTDLVLVEGYKRGAHRKIEARRLEAKDRSPLTAIDPHIAAIAADHAVIGEGVPVFDLDDISGLADFIERETGLG